LTKFSHFVFLFPLDCAAFNYTIIRCRYCTFARHRAGLTGTTRGGSKGRPGGRGPPVKRLAPCGPPMAPSKVIMTQAYC